MTIYGLDYAWDRPNQACLRQNGMSFVCRYISYDQTGKNLTRAEAAALHSNGLAIVVNWEWGKYDPDDGHGKGVTEARDAEHMAASLGVPDDVPIYFSVDFDARGQHLVNINNYFAGVKSVLGIARTGMYGGYDQCDYVYRRGNTRWLWQTYAWSGGRVHSAAHLYQYQNGVTICGARGDRDRALKPAYGAWGAGVAGVGAAIAGAVAGSTSDGWDYSAEIAGTAASIVHLGSTIPNYTALIDQIRKL